MSAPWLLVCPETGLGAPWPREAREEDLEHAAALKQREREAEQAEQDRLDRAKRDSLFVCFSVV